jgi:excisionase family DNA binding protein
MDDTNIATSDRLTISVDEAARLLGISRSFAYELCARKELPSMRLGRRLVVPRRALLELVDEESAASSAHHDQSPSISDVAEA